MAEIILALALVAVAVMALAALSLRSLQANRKVDDTLTGQLVAEQYTERVVYEAESSASAAVWSYSSATVPYQTDVANMGDTAFNVTMYASDVVDVPGQFISGKRLKHLETRVTWQNAPNGKGGYGRLQVHASRLVHEP